MTLDYRLGKWRHSEKGPSRSLRVQEREVGCLWVPSATYVSNIPLPWGGILPLKISFRSLLLMTPYTHSNILPLFEYLAEWTWELLGNARQLRLRVSEDTITDMTAFEIARAGLRGVKIARVTKQEEAFYSFDWMWLIGIEFKATSRMSSKPKR